MTMLRDGLLALLAATGLMTLLWQIAGALLRRREELPAILLVPLRGKAEEMEYTVRRLDMARSRLGVGMPIVLLDAGMDEDARRRASLLAEGHWGVLVMDEAEAADYWK